METLELVSRAYVEAKDIIFRNLDKYCDLVDLLIEKEILYLDDIKKFNKNLEY